MIFSIYITSNTSALQHAFSFVQASVAEGHRINRVFLQDQGVLLLQDSSAPQWSQLAQQHQFEITLCSNAAKQHDIKASNLIDHFHIDSLMQLLEAERDADRLITFRD